MWRSLGGRRGLAIGVLCVRRICEAGSELRPEMALDALGWRHNVLICGPIWCVLKEDGPPRWPKTVQSCNPSLRITYIRNVHVVKENTCLCLCSKAVDMCMKVHL